MDVVSGCSISQWKFIKLGDLHRKNQFRNLLCNANSLNAKLNEFKPLNPFSCQLIPSINFDGAIDPNSYKFGNFASGHRMIRQMFALKLNIRAPAGAEILTLCISSISVCLLTTYRVSVCFAF